MVVEPRHGGVISGAQPTVGVKIRRRIEGKVVRIVRMMRIEMMRIEMMRKRI